MVARAPVVVTMHARIARFFAAELGLSLSPSPVEFQDIAVSMLWHASYDHDPVHAWLRQGRGPAGVRALRTKPPAAHRC